MRTYNWASTACAAIRDRAMQHEAYQRGIAAATAAVADANRLGVDYLRVNGGRTAIARAAFIAEVGVATSPGSKIFGDVPIASLVDQLPMNDIHMDAWRQT